MAAHNGDSASADDEPSTATGRSGRQADAEAAGSDPRDTAHPAGEQQAADNTENESPG